MVLLSLLLPAFLAGQFSSQPTRKNLPPVPSYEVHRAKTPVNIDGRLDDAAWKDAAPITLIFPWKGSGPVQKTTARLLWDDQSLYVSFDCEDSDITAHMQMRDDETYRDDAVELFLNVDPSQEAFYYGFEMNARAILYDYVSIQGRRFLKRYQNEGTQLAVRLRGTLNVSGDKDEGWSLEFAVPWRNFDDSEVKIPPKPGTEMRAILNRWDGTEPNRTMSIWSDPGNDNSWPHVPSRFGRIRFVE